MGRRVSFSPEVLKIEAVGQMYGDTAKSLRFYYHEPGLAGRDVKFIGYSLEDVRQELERRLRELDRYAALSTLSALEASFRMDFFRRCKERWKDDLSRAFRSLYKAKGEHIALEKELLEAWKRHISEAKSLVSELIGAYKYRHWLAHGRYWSPNLGRRYDFQSVYTLAQRMEQVLAEQST